MVACFTNPNVVQAEEPTLVWADRNALEYCPDNTCERFGSVIGVSKEELVDFGFLYLFFFGDYIYLEQWRQFGDHRKTATEILNKVEYSRFSGAYEVNKAKQILLHLSRGDRIRVIFIRYDEGEKAVSPISLNEVLIRKP